MGIRRMNRADVFGGTERTAFRVVDETESRERRFCGLVVDTCEGWRHHLNCSVDDPGERLMTAKTRGYLFMVRAIGARRNARRDVRSLNAEKRRQNKERKIPGRSAA
ncbi:hypothetical protein [Nitrobacter hamburgensis]|uniref:hypothetical protein n=1 Tax=Nitrobacter hamburgensis TaxID=912 RepID=UPI0012EE0413|nr:hypothetical protein [Nitrobacter hamburgensis]